MQKFGSESVYLSGDGTLHQYAMGTLRPISLTAFKYNSDANPFTPEYFGCPVDSYLVAKNSFVPKYYEPKLVPADQVPPGTPISALSVPNADAYFIFLENRFAISAPGHCLNIVMFGKEEAMRRFETAMTGLGVISDITK